jgi:CubicO group peptidase (beta-lactamase class C family)
MGVGSSMTKKMLGLMLAIVLLQAGICARAHGQAVGVATDAASACPVPGASWSALTGPEDAKWSKEKLAAARAYADSIHSAAVIIVQHGKVVDAWGAVDEKMASFSVRKSFLSALYGIYSAEGVINVNATLEQLGINDSPDPLTKAEQQATVVDLLRARSGVYHPVDYETASMKRDEPARGSHAHGTFWYYNNWDFNTLGTIFEKETRLSIGDAFAQRIARPIGMQDFRSSDVYYMGGPISTERGYMFEVTARDMARFGQLYLCGGRWGEKQLVPAAWVEKGSHATEMVKAGKFDLGGYEYLWWVEKDGVLLGDGATLPGMFAAEGAGGHYILIVPSLDMVIVHRVNNEPKSRSTQDAVAAADGPGVPGEQFGHLVKLIVAAQAVP